ncbi:SRPBCC family protein [Nocardioides aequoreus]|uniref:SRPBCC family protein n=1 Tax=Nocardioides aequoreus TaxID=397278 RepID=UPI0004C3F203|nr:SRPBCC family protein [Nocardioides aequoreus]
MDLTHEFTVPAGLEETWAALNDISGVAECFPGAQVTSADDDSFAGSVKVKLGPIALVYNGTGTFTEKDQAAGRMVVDAKGKDKRGNGTAGAHVTVSMTDQGGSTKVTVVTDLAITGKPAQFGRGVIQDVSDKLLGQFTACLESKVGSSPEPEPEEPDERMGNMRRESAPPAAPSAPAGPEASESRMGNMRAVPSDPPPRESAGDDAIDLGATVLPVLAKAYWKQAAAGLVVLLVVLRVLRRR